MKNSYLTSTLALGIVLFTFLVPLQQTEAHDGQHVSYTDGTEGHVFMFGKDNCSYCEEQRTFLEEKNLPYVYLNIVDDPKALRLYNLLLAKHSLPRVTPITIVGEKVFLGFNGARTTGQQIKKQLMLESEIKSIQAHLDLAPIQAPETVGAGCSGTTCNMGNEGQFVFNLPYFGVVTISAFPPVALILISLGIIFLSAFWYGRSRYQKKNVFTVILLSGGLMLLLGSVLLLNPNLLTL